MKKLPLALAAFLFAAPALAPAQDLAPAVKRKPAAPASAAAVAPAAAAPTPAAAPQGVRTSSERDYQAALTAASEGGSDAALEGSLIRVMSRLLAAGRCREATSLATRDGRKELASRAQQLCK